jgi:hypothetical protein
LQYALCDLPALAMPFLRRTRAAGSGGRAAWLLRQSCQAIAGSVKVRNNSELLSHMAKNGATP